MANSNVQPTTPAAEGAIQATDANAPTQNILDDVCVIEGEKVESTEMLARPPLGETREVALENGHNYIFGFDKSEATSFIEENGTLTITFECGGKLVLRNYNTATAGDDVSTFAFSDVIPQGELSSMIKVVDTTKENEEEPLTEKRAQNDNAEDVANIEPAAGDESTNAKKLAQIEPAAGDQGGDASNSGYGFNSPYNAEPVGPLDAVGPLGPTALRYAANFREPNPLTDENPDSNPLMIGPENEFVDETFLGPIVETGTINIDYGADGVGSVGPNGDFAASGSMTGGTLTSNGDPVVVSQTATGYEGVANGVVIFTLDIQSPSGDYTFTLHGPLDHADGTDPNDLINLTFGVVAQDFDGDTVSTSLTVVVADDAPVLDGDGVKVVDEDDLPGASVFGNLIEDFNNDGSGNIHTTGASNASGDLDGGVLRSGGEDVVITFNGTSYTGTTTGGTPVFTLTITNQQTGAYTFNLLQPLDHSVGGDTITLTFGAEIVDYDGDTDLADIVIQIKDDVPEIRDDQPTIGNGLEVIDETNMNNASITANGNLPFDTGADIPATILPNGNTLLGGSFAGPDLTSNGQTVVITQTANGYEGTTTPGGIPVFTFIIGNDGAYSFTQFQQLDHADGTNANDVINLRFGVTITDNDGDTDSGFVNVNIVDDAPVLTGDGLKVVDEDDLSPASVSGNLVEDFGEDGQGDIHTTDTFNASGDLLGGTLTSGGVAVVVTATANGYVGMAGATEVFNITIHPVTGAYTFNLLEGLDHSVGGNNILLTFGAEIVDYDGDTDPADIVIKIKDDQPEICDANPTIGNGLEVVDETNLGPIVRDGNIDFDFGGDGPGTFGPFGMPTSSVPLFSNGQPVSILANGNGYVGVANGSNIFTMEINPDGSYKFTLNGVLDHPDSTNPDDIITLQFGVQVTDADGDSDTGNITVRVHDDGPVAVDDGVFFTDGPVLNGNVLSNDDHGEDGPGAVVAVTFNGATTNIASGATVNINGAHGVLQISSNGTYTYTPNGGTDGTDTFGYTMDDYDDDMAAANLTIRVDNDDCPILIKPAVEVVDETNLGPIVEGGVINANFFGDGPGTFSMDGAFSSSGSKLGGNLTSNGVPVNVTSNATGYTGSAGGTTVFTITINPTTGAYTFTLLDTLDHADGTNPNDVIRLTFGVRGTDADGDFDSTIIRVDVLDDAPVAVDDGNFSGGNVINGNVLANDDAGSDGLGAVVSVTFNGAITNIAPGATVNIIGAHGTLQISSNGNYTYTPDGGTDGTDAFLYTMDDYDNDQSSACLTIRVDQDDCPILIEPAKEVVDETFLGPIVEGGVINANFFGDGPGTFSMNGAFSSGGSKLGGNLTSLGQPVIVTNTATGYVGTAGGAEVFTITINPATGAYTFTLNGVLDHADGANPNDVITLNFGVRGTDTDGDFDSTTIRVDVLDDAPIAHDDHNTQVGIATGNVVTGLNGGPGAADDLSNDLNNLNSNTVTKISFGGNVVNVPAVGQATINGDFGVLKIDSTGAYTYTPNPGATGIGATSETLVLADAASGVKIEVDAVQTATGIQFTIDLVDGIADLNGFFLDLQGNGGPIITLGGGNTMSGTAGFDYAVVIGTVGGNDADTTHAVVTINGLTIGDLENAKIGIRATSVGDCREDSLKLVGDIIVETHDCGCGEDQFVYTLQDRDGDTSTANITFECTPDTDVGITVNNGTDKICIKEDGEGTVPVVANYTGGDGDEVLTLTVTGIQPNWTITAPGWTNSGGGVYTLTLPVGQHNYAGNFTFKPPHDSDVDMKDLVFTATVSDPDTGGSKTATDLFTVQVDAVIDTPVLDVSNVATQNWYYSHQGYQVPLNIASNTTDIDGSEIVTKIVIDLNQPLSNPVPPFTTLDSMGIGLNKGTETSPGIWEITVNAGNTAVALDGLKLVVPNNMDYGPIHNSNIGGNESVNIIVKSFVKEKVAPGDGNGECDFTDNQTCVIKSICLTFRITPLVLDLNGNGIELVPAEAGVMFDMNNNGTLDKTTWVAGSDGLLAIDANGDGTINNQSELFGNTETLDNGFANLAQHDSNADGKIDSADSIFGDLRVWTDVNQDGISQSDELHSLSDLGIASINVNASEIAVETGDAYISHESTYTTNDGVEHEIADVSFNVIEGNNIDDGVTLDGTEGTDAIYGTANNDVLIGNAGNDLLFGGEGDDVFAFNALDGSVDTIADFGIGDVLDVIGLLEGYDPVQDSINDFVFGTEVDGNTVISVDTTGTGDVAHATVIAVVEGITGLDLHQIVQANNHTAV